MIIKKINKDIVQKKSQNKKENQIKKYKSRSVPLQAIKEQIIKIK